MSQWLSSAGTWTCWVFLSTVRLRWVLSRSSFTWCQCWSSSRLPRDTRSCPPEDELTPTTGLRKWKTIDFVAVMVCVMAAQWLQVMQKSSYVHFLLRNFDSFLLPQKHYKVSILLLLLHNASLTRTTCLKKSLESTFALISLRSWAWRKVHVRLINTKSERKGCSFSGIFSSLFLTGSVSLRSLALIKAQVSICCEGGGRTVNDEAAKWQQDIINDRPNTSRFKLENPCLKRRVSADRGSKIDR